MSETFGSPPPEYINPVINPENQEKLLRQERIKSEEERLFVSDNDIETSYIRNSLDTALSTNPNAFGKKGKLEREASVALSEGRLDKAESSLRLLYFQLGIEWDIPTFGVRNSHEITDEVNRDLTSKLGTVRREIVREKMSPYLSQRAETNLSSIDAVSEVHDGNLLNAAESLKRMRLADEQSLSEAHKLLSFKNLESTSWVERAKNLGIQTLKRLVSDDNKPETRTEVANRRLTAIRKDRDQVQYDKKEDLENEFSTKLLRDENPQTDEVVTYSDYEDRYRKKVLTHYDAMIVQGFNAMDHDDQVRIIDDYFDGQQNIYIARVYLTQALQSGNGDEASKKLENLIELKNKISESEDKFKFDSIETWAKTENGIGGKGWGYLNLSVVVGESLWNKVKSWYKERQEKNENNVNTGDKMSFHFDRLTQSASDYIGNSEKRLQDKRAEHVYKKEKRAENYYKNIHTLRTVTLLSKQILITEGKRISNFTKGLFGINTSIGKDKWNQILDRHGTAVVDVLMQDVSISNEDGSMEGKNPASIKDKILKPFLMDITLENLEGENNKTESNKFGKDLVEKGVQKVKTVYIPIIGQMITLASEMEDNQIEIAAKLWDEASNRAGIDPSLKNAFMAYLTEFNQRRKDNPHFAKLTEAFIKDRFLVSDSENERLSKSPKPIVDKWAEVHLDRMTFLEEKRKFEVTGDLGGRALYSALINGDRSAYEFNKGFEKFEEALPGLLESSHTSEGRLTKKMTKANKGLVNVNKKLARAQEKFNKSLHEMQSRQLPVSPTGREVLKHSAITKPNIDLKHFQFQLTVPGFNKLEDQYNEVLRLTEKKWEVVDNLSQQLGVDLNDYQQEPPTPTLPDLPGRSPSPTPVSRETNPNIEGVTLRQPESRRNKNVDTIIGQVLEVDPRLINDEEYGLWEDFTSTLIKLNHSSPEDEIDVLSDPETDMEFIIGYYSERLPASADNDLAVLASRYKATTPDENKKLTKTEVLEITGKRLEILADLHSLYMSTWPKTKEDQAIVTRLRPHHIDDGDLDSELKKLKDEFN